MLIRVARRYLAARRARTQIVPGSMFSDPAWDILLDLFVARMEGVPVSVTSACVASGAATSTALHWINRMELKGLLTRVPDPADRRRTYLEIDPDTGDAVAEWLRMAFFDDRSAAGAAPLFPMPERG